MKNTIPVILLILAAFAFTGPAEPKREIQIESCVLVSTPTQKQEPRFYNLEDFQVAWTPPVETTLADEATPPPVASPPSPVELKVGPVPAFGTEGLAEYAILFFRDAEQPSRDAAENVAADFVDSQWHVITLPLDHPLAAEFGVVTAPTIVAIHNGTETGRTSATKRGTATELLYSAYPSLYKKPVYASVGSGWTVGSLKTWLATYARNKDKGIAPVRGMTVRWHLESSSETGNHGYPPSLVGSLTQREQQLLHDADHDRLVSPAGPLASPMAKPTSHKPFNTVQPPKVRYTPPSNCPNGQCPKPQTFRRFF